MTEQSSKKPPKVKRDIVPRTAKWQIHPTEEQLALILKISSSLRFFYNWAITTQNENHAAHKAAKNEGREPEGKAFLSDFDLYGRFMKLRDAADEDSPFRAKVPANWVLETFRAAVAGYKSFFTSVKNNDPDARTPRPKDESFFQAIPGCSFVHRGDAIILAPDIFGKEMLRFPLPGDFQRKLLGRSIRNAKFVISRDEKRLDREGRYFLSITFEIAVPDPVPFDPNTAVYIALGASSIGIVSPQGEETIPLWRADKHWKPRTDAIEASLSGMAATAKGQRPVQKGSRKWNRLEAKRRKMFRIMGAQQQLDRRSVVARDLLAAIEGNEVFGHGIHFVVTDMVVRSKPGKLADGEKSERGGSQGLNWAAQNTGTIGYLVDWLSKKVREHGGSVRKHKLNHSALPAGLGIGHESKIAIARALRDDFLRHYEAA